MGLSYKQMAVLKEAGSLDRTVLGLFNNVQKDYFWKRSYYLTKKAEDFLKPYCKQYMPEARVRQLIHQTGIRTYPRPHGIPANYRVKITKDGAGMLYVHPEHEHISIRVMPGKPYSYNPLQKEPYVIQMKDGMAIDRFGNKVKKTSQEAHVPLKKFIFRG